MQGKIKVYKIEWLALIVISLVVFFIGDIVGVVWDFFPSRSKEVRSVAVVDLNEYVDASSLKVEGKEVSLAKNVFKVDDKILIHAAGRLLAFDKEGKNIWSRDIRAEETDILKWGENTLILDKLSGNIVVINPKNEIISSLQNIGEIEKIKVSKDYVFTKFSGRNSVDIYDKELKRVATANDEYGEIIKFVVDENSSKLFIYTTSIGENKLKSFLYVYDKDANLVGSSDLDSSIVFDIIIDKNINVLCDDKILIFTKKAALISEMPYEGYIDMIRAKADNIYAVFSKGVNAEYKRTLKKFDNNLEEKKALNIQNTAKGLELGNKYMLVYGEDKISVMDYGMEKAEIVNTNIKVNKLNWISKNNFYITDNQKVYIYQIN